MVQCYLCKGKLRVTRDKHVYDEKLKKRYHFKCFAGICRVCDEPVYSKSNHKTIGSNVWHEHCYKKAHAKRRNPVKTIKDASWKAMVAARKAAGVPKKLWREFEETYFKKHPPKFERKNPLPESPIGITEPEDFFRWWSQGLSLGLIRHDGKVLEGPDTKRFLNWWVQGFTLGIVKVKDPMEISNLDEILDRLARTFTLGIAAWKRDKTSTLKDNPRRPTKEFWDKTYPGVLAGYKKKYPKAEAEERARKTTAAIWYDKMSPKKKAKYERIRRKREARENPLAQKVAQEEKDWAAKMLVKLGTAKNMEEAHKLIDEYRTKRQAKKNPMLITPEQETDIVGAFRRVIQGVGDEADKALVRMAREADVVMSTGPSVLLKRNPEEPLTIFNPVKGKVDYIIQDEFGKVYETGTGTQEEAEARALVFNRKYMREFKVIYPKGEPADIKKAAEKATKDLLKR